MRDKETAARINERIENAISDIQLVEDCQPLPPGRWNFIERLRRAELLRRNEKFISELQEADRLLRNRFHRKGQDLLSGSREEDEGWQDFCYRWGIENSWAGDLKNLGSYAWIAEAALYYRKPGEEPCSILLGACKLGKHSIGSPRDRRASRWPQGVRYEQSFIYLKIVPSLRLEDIRLVWRGIEALKSVVWGFSERAKQNFERDLCFWDLKKKPEEYGKMSYGDIIQKWNAAKPARQKVKNTDAIKKAVKLIQTYIDRLMPIEG